MRVLTPRAGPALPPLPRRRTCARRAARSCRSSSCRPTASRSRRTSPASSSRCASSAGGERLLRSYSLSRSPRADGYRISVKREPGGVVSEHLHTRARRSATRSSSARPPARFVLGERASGRVVLVSAGIGVTPVLAMLDALAERAQRARGVVDPRRAQRRRARVPRRGARPRRAPRATGAATSATAGPNARDRPRPRLRRRRPPDRRRDPRARRAARRRVPPLRPDALRRRPDRRPARARRRARAHRQRELRRRRRAAPAIPRAAAGADARDGPAVAFSRSGVTTAWDSSFASLLDLAEANAVPAALGLPHRRLPRLPRRRARRAPSATTPSRSQPPAAGSALLCCAVPDGDVVLDA